jgi:uncharacterized membrane protein YdjX (TVP38/TMEM64 family)
MQPFEHERKLNAPHRMMIILWFAFVSMIGIYFLISLFIPQADRDDGQDSMLTGNRFYYLLFIIAVIGLLAHSPPAQPFVKS